MAREPETAMPEATMVPEAAMVLAAGLGTRMRPITDHTPKPLVAVAGRTLLDRALDALVAAGVRRAVVNVHHLADQIEDHLAGRTDIETAVSDERDLLMDSGGGVRRALPHLPETFFVLNADTFWVDESQVDGGASSLRRMARDYAPHVTASDGGATPEMRLLLVPHERAVGFAGRGDFFERDGRLERRGERERAPLIYAGAILAHRAAFEAAPTEPFSLNRLFDEAIAAGRLTGTVMDGLWLHVGTPDAVGEAEAALRERAA